jgi:hypothetical protein
MLLKKNEAKPKQKINSLKKTKKMKKRNYSGSDANMAETARTTHGLFVNDLSSFTAFDADLNQSYADDFETNISAAETVVRDTAIIDQQAQLR